MKMARSYESLPVWAMLLDYVKIIYTITSTFPPEEKEGLARKLRTKVTEIPVLVAGATSGRGHEGSGAMLTNASAALMETDTLLLLCAHLGILSSKEYENLQEEIDTIGGQIRALASRMGKKA